MKHFLIIIRYLLTGGRKKWGGEEEGNMNVLGHDLNYSSTRTQ